MQTKSTVQPAVAKISKSRSASLLVDAVPKFQRVRSKAVPKTSKEEVVTKKEKEAKRKPENRFLTFTAWLWAL